jgi:hypothetical protein
MQMNGRTYQVVVLPQGEVAARGCSLTEAEAWIRTYNEIMQPGPQQAVIAEEPAAAANPFATKRRAA